MELDPNGFGKDLVFDITTMALFDI